MTFDTFKETVLSALSNYYGSDYTLSIQKIPKNNQIILDGLTIQKKGQNISPTIYLNPYFSKFQDGMPMFHILEEIKNTYAMHHPDENIDIRFFTDYENAKDRILYEADSLRKKQRTSKRSSPYSFSRPRCRLLLSDSSNPRRAGNNPHL